ncbi:unnamed protein product [Lathyrus sativus]|nr:unnamed protein product [Lathyrus sativus]
MEISGSSKKRKIICCEEDEEKEKEDEAKMETFFALVRSMRETRDRWKNKMNEDLKEKNRIVGVWKPTFQLEDFAEEGADQSDRCRNRDPRVEIIDGVSTKSNNDKEDDAENGIDLKLSL